MGGPIIAVELKVCVCIICSSKARSALVVWGTCHLVSPAPPILALVPVVLLAEEGAEVTRNVTLVSSERLSKSWEDHSKVNRSTTAGHAPKMVFIELIKLAGGQCGLNGGEFVN